MTRRQILALAEALRHDGRFAPRVCCPSGTPLALAAGERRLPLIPLRGAAPANPLSLFRLWNGSRHGQPLLAHSFTPSALQAGRYLARLRSKDRTARMHSCFAPPVPSLTPRALAAWEETDGILCGDGVILSALADAGITPGRMAVIRPGLDLAELPDEASPRTRRRFIFAALEPLETGRGMEVFLKAMAALWQRTDLGDWEVRVAGEGKLFNALLDEARSLGVESRLALLGRQPPAAVLPLAHALVVPCTEVHGNVMALAWGWGLGMPVICTRVPGHAEATDGNALTLTPGEPQELAAAMIRVMRDRELRRKLADAGWAMRSRISTERMARQCIDAYVRCASSRGWVLPPPRMFTRTGIDT